MSSTNSTGTEYGRGRGHRGVQDDSSCGLVGSIFSGGCRGRAEAFARRLHRRLTSLGNADDTSESFPHATVMAAPAITKPITREVASWLHAPSEKTITVAPLGNNPMGRVYQRQPRHPAESELYYDFEDELDFEQEPSSPVEEVTAAELADLLVNTEILKTNHHDTCHCSPNGPRLGIDQDSESECVYVSPVSGTSPVSESSEIYFDPESSDPEKNKNEIYFDPVTSSESEQLTSNNLDDISVKEQFSLSGIPIQNISSIYREDSSDSSLSSNKNKPLERLRFDTRQNKTPIKEPFSSEDSLNGRSSRETTSPSHESLWSTFDDDSTVSLKDDTTPRNSYNYLQPRKHLTKSHSDSEIPDNIIGTLAGSTLPLTVERNEEEGCDVLDFPNISKEQINDTILDSSCDCVKDEPIINVTMEKMEPISDDSPTDVNDQFETDLEESVTTTVVTDHEGDHSTYVSTLNLIDELVVECPTGKRLTEKLDKLVINEVTLQIEDETVLAAKKDEKMCLFINKDKCNGNQDVSMSKQKCVDGRVISKETKNQEEKEEEKEEVKTGTEKREGEGQVNVEEEEEEEEEEEQLNGRPRRIRRSSSLKTGKTPPGTPGRKKIVRFADVLGLDLADVRTFLDEIPKIPNSAYNDLIYDDGFQKESSPLNLGLSTGNWDNRYSDRRGSSVSRIVDRTLVPLFQQPGGLSNFLDLIRERKVCLENVLVQDPISLSIQGTVRVLNLDFHKSVHIRYTLNSWKNFSDLQATYISNSCDGFSDKFSFVLYCHTLTIGQKLEFAVRFQCKGTQFWDSNDGANYCFQCLPVSSNVGYGSITTKEKQKDRDWSPIFY